MIRTNKEGKTEIGLINIFESIQGEAYASGKPTVFIRTFGCNLRCSYCDTKECWSKPNLLKVYPDRATREDPLLWMTAQQIFDRVEEIEKNYLHKSICLTGGEPLMEDNKSFMMDELLPLFVLAGYSVDIETDGAVDYAEYKHKFGNSYVINAEGDRAGITIIADYKLPHSGMTSRMLQSNLSIYSDTDIIKMVISDDARDWEELDRVVNSGTRASIYLSPCFGEVTLPRIPAYVVEHADKPIRAQIQAHKVFWSPAEKDV